MTKQRFVIDEFCRLGCEKQNESMTFFCYRRVLQQQVKRSIAAGYAVWVAKSKTSQ